MTHKPTEKSKAEVQALASFGVGQRDISAYLGLTNKTLSKYYREQLDMGMAQTNAAVGKFLAKLATGRAMEEGATWRDCATAAFFWGKTHMGLRETSRHELTSPDGSMTPQVIERVIVNAKD